MQRDTKVLLAFVLAISVMASLVGCNRAREAARRSDGDSEGAEDAAGHETAHATMGLPMAADEGQGPGMGGDHYDYLEENDFIPVAAAPLSTFSIDVDTASYSKTRMYLLQQSQLPPAGAVRIEEFVNYFDYEYPDPTGEHPFSTNVEVATCPWQPEHRLVRVGLQGERMEQGERPAANLVFLLDVSGSMNYPNKLPLVKQAIRMLTQQLNGDDSVALVVYAGAAGLVLDATSAADSATILAALDHLEAGGSTNGGEGIRLAYQVARDNFIENGINRVILCSDGDFNVGLTSTSGLVEMAADQAQDGIFLSVLGFGTGNHNDAMLEQLSNRANGNYAFIDSQLEARKVMVDQVQGTLQTIAKDVKIQVEFNPAQVYAYRLIGYENRLLADRDFADDTKDAGEIGAGHQVTALYEVVPVGAEDSIELPETASLRYQGESTAPAGEVSDELLTVNLRYKLPEEDTSTLLAVNVPASDQGFGESSEDFRLAASVAAFGMLLRGSQYAGDTDYDALIATIASCQASDPHGYRGELLQLVRRAQAIGELTPSDESAGAGWQLGRAEVGSAPLADQ